MARVYNFSAGPSTLPESVLTKQTAVRRLYWHSDRHMKQPETLILQPPFIPIIWQITVIMPRFTISLVSVSWLSAIMKRQELHLRTGSP